MVAPLPPGTLLQLMYLRERLRKLSAGRFVEVGPGSGEVTSLLLSMGWTGAAYDLDAQTVGQLNRRFAGEIAGRRLTTMNADYMASCAPDTDLVISCMVMEHMDQTQQRAFMTRAAANLRPGGRMVGMVPASPRHWGIEDDIAGHYLRFTRAGLRDLTFAAGWKLTHTAGLTCPLSNMLLPISNMLVRRQERDKLALSQLERTKQSGRRQVQFKTHFPSILGLFLNEIFLAPVHLLQKLCSHSERALVLYFEAQPEDPSAVAHG